MDRLIHGFRILSRNELPEIQAEGIYARHEKTGLEVYHILNDDEENLFAFAFMTPPYDSSGVAHIVEHSVFCGSKNYPMKDPFLVLSKQSIHTFLNAMTFPDKTVYPASSIIEADYFNLMAVYGDAVFFPLLKQEVFEQEGIRLERDSNGEPFFSGVVFNEMRGTYNDFETIMDRWSRRLLFRGTVYEHDSGGYPPEIAALSYSDFLAFHQKYYHPVNCKLFLYGNIPTEKQLAFIDRHFLQDFQAAEKPPLIPPIPVCTEPQRFSVTAPAGAGKNPEKISVILNWMLSEASNIDRLMDFILLETVLLGHDGAPLQKKLLETPLAEDVYPYNGIQADLKNHYFTVGLVDLEKNSEQSFETFVFTALQEIITEGIPLDTIESALHLLDFGNREIIRAGGPFALTFMRRCLRSWIHGGSPEDALRVIPAFERLKQRVMHTPRYLEQLIQTALLENTHRVLIAVQPDPDFAAGIDAQLAQLAQAAAKQAAAAPVPKPSDGTAHTAAGSETGQSACGTVHIPHVSKADLPPLRRPIAQTLDYFAAVPVLFHEQPTNDISYVDIAVPIDGFSEQEYELLPLYSAAFADVGTDSKPWEEISALVSKFTGGFGALAITTEPFGGDFPELSFQLPPHIMGRDWVLIRSKMLPDCLHNAFQVIFSYIREMSFTDHKRLRDIFIQFKNDADSIPGYAGHRLASLHAGQSLAASRYKENTWMGVPQIRFLREWYKKLEVQPEAIGELADALTALHQKLLVSGMLVKICSTKTGIAEIKPLLAAHLPFFSSPVPPKPAVLCSAAPAGRLTFFPSAVQVGFAALSIPVTYSPEEIGAVLVYTQILETETLWNAVRVEGGAYGVSAYYDMHNHIFTVTVVRDPDPQKSLCAVLQILRTFDFADLTDANLEALIIGTYGLLLHPQAPAQTSAGAFSRLLNGIPASIRKQAAAGILSCTAEKLHECAEKLAAALPYSHACCVGSSALLQENTELTAYFGPAITEAAV